MVCVSRLAGLAVFLTLSGFACSGQDPVPVAAKADRPAVTRESPIIAQGRGLTVRESDLESALARVRAEAVSRGKPLTEEQVSLLRPRLLDQLVLMGLCDARAEEADRVLARVQARKFIESLRARQAPEAFLRLLKAAGYESEAAFEKDKVAEALVTAVLDREVKGQIRIPSGDVREYYEANPDRWVEPASVRFLHLRAPHPASASEPAPQVRQRVEGWRQELASGRDFGSLLRRVTAGERPLATGGEERAVAGQLPPELEAVVFRLEPGKPAEWVEAEGSFHLVQVLERIPSRRLPLEKVEEDIRAVLIQREMGLRIPEYLRRIRAEAGVEVFR